MTLQNHLPQTWKLLENEHAVSLDQLTGAVLRDLVPDSSHKNLDVTLRRLSSDAKKSLDWAKSAVAHLTWAEKADVRGTSIRKQGGVHPLALPYAIGVLLIDAAEQNPALQQATLDELHAAWTRSLAGDDRGLQRSLRATGVLIVVVRGAEGRMPDLYAVAMRRDEPNANGGENESIGVLRVLVGQAVQAAADGKVPRKLALQRALDPLASFVSATRDALQNSDAANAWRGPFGTFDKARAYDAFRGRLRETLERVMRHIEFTTGAPAKDEAALTELREAASVLAFRVFFVVAIESRGLLYAPGFTPKYAFRGLTDAGQKAPESSFLLLQDLTAVIRGKPRVTGSRTRLDLAIHGASIFANRPNEHFSDGLEAWLDALDAKTKAIATNHTALNHWNALIADLALLATGQISRYADAVERAPDTDVSLGGSAHVQRILGDVYEQILAMVPVAEGTGAARKLRLVAPGTKAAKAADAAGGKDGAAAVKAERKALGAHYTPEALVIEVVRAALEPAFAAAWSRAGQDVGRYQSELLDLRVLDPAMGSAHFLTVAALEIAREMAFAEHEGQPRPAEHFEYITNPNAWGALPEDARAVMDTLAAGYLSQVAERCCHGVDVAPLAVELGKLALWQLTMVERTLRGIGDAAPPPSLTFLDANLRCGDSLLGASAADVEAVCREFELEGAEGDLFNFASVSPKSAVGHMRRLEALLSGPADALRAEIKASRASIMRELGAVSDPLPADDHLLRTEIFALLQAAKERYRWLWDLAFLRAWWAAKPGKGGGADGLFASLKPGGAKTWAGLLGLAAPTPAQQAARDAVRGQARALRAFHWELEFSAVFHRPARGFDVIVANPPFLGDRDLRAARTEQGVTYLRNRYTDGNTPDLCGFFVLTFRDRLSPTRGVAGTVAPNTIAQAKNRTTALVPLVAGDAPEFEIFRSCQTRVWPGDAAVHIATIHMRRAGQLELAVEPRRIVQVAGSEEDSTGSESDDGPEESGGATTAGEAGGLKVLPSGGVFDCSFLDGGVETTLLRLRDQDALAYNGMLPRGAFDRSLSFIREVPKQEHRSLFAYLNNRDIQQQRSPDAQRVIIDFYDALVSAGLAEAAPNQQASWLQRAENFPSLFLELKRTVFAERFALPDSQRNKRARSKPWLFEDTRPGLRVAWSGLTSVIAIGAIGKSLKPVLTSVIDPNTGLRILPTHKLFIVPTESRAVLSVSNSVTFECSVRRHCSTLGVGLNFSPTDVLPYFPFPWKGEPTGNEYVAPVLNPPPDVEQRLAPPASALLKLREELLTQPTKHGLGTAEFRGPTALYNAFDNPDDQRPAIEALRAAHRTLEAAVLAEYGWSDLAGPERWTFDRPWIDGTWRYVPDLATRREYLKRLEALNHEQAAAAGAAPTHPRKSAAPDTVPPATPTPEAAQPAPGATPAPRQPTPKPMSAPAPAPAKDKAPVPKPAPAPPRRSANPTPAPAKPATKPAAKPKTPLDAVLAVLRAAEAPLNKAEILARSHVDESDWAALRARIEEDPEVVRFGAARGTRYATRTCISNRIVAVLTDAGDAGLRKSEILEALAEEDLLLDDDLWTESIRTLLEGEVVTKSGQAKGTRYHANA